MAADEVDPNDLEIADELIAERRKEKPGETPEDMTAWQRPITGGIDVLNDWAGKILCLLMVPLIAVVVFEVFARNGFAIFAANGWDDFARSIGLGPTVFAYDISRMISGVLFMGAAGYGLMRGVHIRADFLYRNWSDKTQATVDATLYMLFFIPSMIFFTIVASKYWMVAFSSGETAFDSTWEPVLWPARLAMPIGGLLLLLQGFPELFRAFHKMGKERESVFVKLLIPYFVILAAVVISVFAPDVLPLGEWLSGLFGDGPGLSKPTIGLIMLASLLFAIFVGFPISFTLIFLAFVFGIWGSNFKLTTLLMTLNTNSTMLNDQLMAVPLFILMGIVMEAAGLMERLFASIQMIMARVRGALFIAVLIVSTIFAAATGIVGASVTLLGIMAGATMSRSGYDVKLAAGTITAGGTLGILIPPSIMLIVMGPVLEVSTLDLFRGAFIPGAILATLYLVYTLGRCWLNPELGPILSEEDQPDTSKYYGAEVALICLGVLTICRVFGLGIGGAFGGLVPFGGLIVLVIALLVAYRAYRQLNVLRIVLPIALLFHGYMIFAKSGADGLAVWPIVLFVFMLLLAFLARPIYSANADKEFYFSELWDEFFAGLMPPTILISFALGSILLGFATPAEAAAMGAFGSILLSIMYKKFSIPSFFDSLIKALEITVLIMFLVAASNFFGAEFSSLGTPKMMTEILLGLDMSPYLILLMVMALIFLLGWPLEWVPIVLIVVPILLPTVAALDIHGLNRYDLMVWFGILVAVNLQTAWLSPPVALSAYFLKGVVPNWDLKDIYLGMMQFMVVQLIGLTLLFIFPQLVLWLPKFLGG